MLPIATLKKYLRECFGAPLEPADEPIGESEQPRRLLHTRSSQRDWLTMLEKRLGGLPRTRATLLILGAGAAARERLDVCVEAPAGKGHKVGDDRFTLAFEVLEGDAGLWLRTARQHGAKGGVAGPIAAVREIERFLERVRERQDKLAFDQQREAKLVALKRRGLLGRLAELSGEHRFDYCVQEATREIKLSLRLEGRKTGYHMSFPKGRLDAMLGELPTLVDGLRHMHSLGITFQGHNRGATRNVQWTLASTEPAAE